MQKKAEIILLLTTIFWASAFIVVKDAVRYIEPFTFVALRFLIAAFFYFPLVIATKQHKKAFLFNREGFLLGLTFALGFMLQTVALVHTSASNSAFLTSLFVIFVPLLSFLFFKEKFSARVLWGLLLAVFGLYFLSKPDFSQKNILGIGDFLSILCALAFAAQIILLSRYTKKGNAVLLVWQQVFWCGVLCGVVAFIFESRSTDQWFNLFHRPRVWGGVLYCAFFCTAFAFWIQGVYQRHTTDVRATLIYTAEPVLATLMALALKQEELSETKLLAFIFLFAGILLALEPSKIEA